MVSLCIPLQLVIWLFFFHLLCKLPLEGGRHGGSVSSGLATEGSWFRNPGRAASELWQAIPFTPLHQLNLSEETLKLPSLQSIWCLCDSLVVNCTTDYRNVTGSIPAGIASEFVSILLTLVTFTMSFVSGISPWGLS